MFEDVYCELEETIKLECENIEKLESIIEAKRKHIADCLKVIEALEEGDFVEDNYFKGRA